MHTEAIHVTRRDAGRHSGAGPGMRRVLRVLRSVVAHLGFAALFFTLGAWYCFHTMTTTETLRPLGVGTAVETPADDGASNRAANAPRFPPRFDSAPAPETPEPVEEAFERKPSWDI